MEINAETLIAISGLITGVLASIGVLVSSKRNAKKDEVILLREEVERLHKSNQDLEEEVTSWRKKFEALFEEVFKLRNENIWLKSILAKNGIEIPPMPDYMIEEEKETRK